jgi:LacI family fructose operon transcriptional repressor
MHNRLCYVVQIPTKCQCLLEILMRMRALTDQNAKKTTIYDLAQLAGTSAGTVSAVLNGNWKKRRISEKLATKVRNLADEHGYALNMQASTLRKEKSGIIGMVVPMYDNRYFSSIAQTFERMARAAGYFPIVTCTQRDPELELTAARTMLAYQVEYLICTGATDPDKIHDLCAPAGVPTLNLDLPGKKASSVISDNYAGAFKLTQKILAAAPERSQGSLFVGGREADHNTQERIRGFRNAHAEIGITVTEDQILACGYASEKAAAALSTFLKDAAEPPATMFVNSTISLEGVVTSLRENDRAAQDKIVIGCFDWDPFAELLGGNIFMVRQDVETMMNAVFSIIRDGSGAEIVTIEVPPIL